jgi:hypothetical protein
LGQPSAASPSMSVRGRDRSFPVRRFPLRFRKSSGGLQSERRNRRVSFSSSRESGDGRGRGVAPRRPHRVRSPPSAASTARRSAAQFLGHGRNPEDTSNDRLVPVHECKGCAFLAAHGVEITYLRTECGCIVPVTVDAVSDVPCNYAIQDPRKGRQSLNDPLHCRRGCGPNGIHRRTRSSCTMIVELARFSSKHSIQVHRRQFCGLASRKFSRFSR